MNCVARQDKENRMAGASNRDIGARGFGKHVVLNLASAGFLPKHNVFGSVLESGLLVQV